MSENSVTLLAGAGVLVKYSGISFIIDGLHCERALSFSTMDAEAISAVTGHSGDFAYINAFFVTHGHTDHYNERLLVNFSKSHGETQIVSPLTLHPTPEAFYPVRGKDGKIELDGISLRFKKLTHDGAKFADYLNYGYVITINGFNILTLGDAGFFPNEIAPLVSGTDIDLALLNFPLLNLRNGRKLINEVIKPQMVLAVHMPFPEDDMNGYIEGTARCLERFADELPPTALMYNHFQKEEI